MDQYLLCVLNDALSEKDYTIIKKSLDVLFPTSQQCQHVANFVESVAVLLNPTSKHIVVLNTCGESESIEWKLLKEDENALDIIECDVRKSDSAIGIDCQDLTDYISSSLHSLADQLPTFGTYRLDILLGSDVLKDLSVSKEPTLASAFIRLSKWHSAHFTIFEQQKFDLDRLSEWCEIINADILLHDSKLILGPTLWRGAIELHSSNTKDTVYNGFQLKLDLNKNYCCNLHPVKNNCKQDLDHFVLSSKLQVIDEVSFTSIPPYLITPVIFRLHLGKPNILNENSSYFIEYLLSNEEVALIVKLGYIEAKGKVKPERKYCSSRWQKVISSGFVKDSECFVSSFEKFITFAITKLKNSNDIVAYPLRDPSSLNADFYYNIVNSRICSKVNPVPEEKSNLETNLEIPSISDSELQKIMLTYLEQSIVKNGSSDCKNLLFLLENIRKSSSSFSIKESKIFSIDEIDPSDWPERIQLLHKQMENEDKKKSVPTNSILAQKFKLPQQSFSLSSNNIIENFLPSGELKESKYLEIISPINNTNHLVTSDLNDVLESKWPEIMNSIYHDLYYNSSNEAEDKESLGSQLIKLYVQHETASTCNNQQLTQNFQIIVSKNVPSPSKAFKGPSSRETNVSNKKRHIRNSASPMEHTLKDLISKKILSKSYTQNTVEIKKISKETNKKNVKSKNLVPVRCSPRKKNPVNYKYPSSTTNNKGSNITESNKMSDLLKKKLRHAVAKALEDNGINFGHPMFQSCGAKLRNICLTFLDDLKLKKGRTSEYLQKIADAHVKQVIEFYQD